MNEDIKDLKDLISKFIDECCLYNRIYHIYEIFKDYFGNNNVDLQGGINREDIQNFLEKEIVSSYVSTLILNDSKVGNDCGNYNLIELPKEKAIRILNLLRLPEHEQIINRILRMSSVSTLSSSAANIIVRFPSVTITNEHNRSINIEELYAKISINYYGILADAFKLNRSQYSITQYLEGYMHSHVSTLPITEPSVFQYCCLGSGPIKNTINSLENDYSEDIWKLFCLELDKYVHTESLTGIPYHRLEEIGYSNSQLLYGNPFNFPIVNKCSMLNITSIEKEFVRYLIGKNILKFSYIGNSYTLGANQLELLLLISNSFIEWYNNIFSKDITKEKVENSEYYTPQFLKSSKFLIDCIIHNKCLYIKRNDNIESNIEVAKSNIGKQVLVFKGKPVYLSITGLENMETDNTITLINPHIVSCWLCKILKVLNYRYGRAKTEYNKEIEYL